MVIIKWKGKVYSFSVAWPLVLFMALLLVAYILSARPDPKDRAVATIQRIGGEFELDEQSPGQPLVKVDFSFTQVTDDDMVGLKGLADLRELYLCGTDITDAGLEQVRGLRALEVLDLWRCGNVTDAGLEHLEGMSSLRRLSLWNTEITDVGLGHVVCLTSLRELDLSHTQITHDGLEQVKALPSLQRIELVGCENFTDADIDDLKAALPQAIITR